MNRLGHESERELVLEDITRDLETSVTIVIAEITGPRDVFSELRGR